MLKLKENKGKSLQNALAYQIFTTYLFKLRYLKITCKFPNILYDHLNQFMKKHLVLVVILKKRKKFGSYVIPRFLGTR